MKYNTVKLGDYLYIKGRIGWKGLKKNEYLPYGNYRIINGESLTVDGIDWNKAGYITKERYDESPEIMLMPDDILISKDGTIGKIGYVQTVEKPTTVASGIFVVRNLRPTEINTRFIYHFFTSKYFKNFITMRTEGSVIPHLYQKDFIELDIPLPNIATQQKIAGILSSLDDKIELNNRINENLEAQAQAMYNQLCECTDNAILGDLITVIESGSRPKGGAISTGIPSIGAEKVEKFGIYDYSKEKYVSKEYFKRLKRGIVNSGDVLLYKDGAYTGKSSMALDGFPYDVCAVNEHVFLLRTKDNYAQAFLYFTLRNDDVRKTIHTLACGKAAQPGLNQQELLGVQIKMPSKDNITLFEEQVNSLMRSIALNALESKHLAEIRDTILPRLMSGELDVSDLDI